MRTFCTFHRKGMHRPCILHHHHHHYHYHRYHPITTITTTTITTTTIIQTYLCFRQYLCEETCDVGTCGSFRRNAMQLVQFSPDFARKNYYKVSRSILTTTTATVVSTSPVITNNSSNRSIIIACNNNITNSNGNNKPPPKNTVNSCRSSHNNSNNNNHKWLGKAITISYSIAPITTAKSKTVSRVPDQNGVSLLYIVVEIHHSGRQSSVFAVADHQSPVYTDI